MDRSANVAVIAKEFFDFTSTAFEQKLESETEKAHRERLHRLERELQESKQNIVKHLKRTRELEKYIQHNALVGQALHSKVERSLLGTGNSPYARYMRMLLSGELQLRLDDGIVHYIEKEVLPAREVPFPGIAKVIYQAVIHYHDEGLLLKLDSFSMDTSRMNVSFFAKVADAASKRSLSAYDAVRMFSRAQLLVQEGSMPVLRARRRQEHQRQQLQLQQQGLAEGGAGTDESPVSVVQVQWEVLKNLLRKQLLLVHAIRAVCASHEYAMSQQSASSAASALFSGHPSHPSHPSPKNNHGVSRVTAAAADRGKKGTNKLSKAQFSKSAYHAGKNIVLPSLSKSEGLANNNISGGGGGGGVGGGATVLASPGRLRPQDGLAHSLERSRLKQSSLQSKISSNIASLYGSELVSAEQVRDHGGARALRVFRSLAAQRMQEVLQQVLFRHLGAMLRKWARATERMRIERAAVSVLRQVGAARISQVVELGAVKLMYQALCKLRSFALVQRYREYSAAAAQLQRYWRGCLVRKRLAREKRRLAAINVQKFARIVLANKAKLRMLRFVKLSHAAESIQRMYKCFRWNRVMNKSLRALYRNRKALMIQKHVRAVQGRRRFQRINLERKRREASVQIQTAQRRRAATKRVGRLRWQKREKEAATQLQRVARGRQGRSAVRHIRHIHGCAAVLQYAWFRFKAVREKNRRLRQRSAIKIQKVARGRIGRAYYKQLRLIYRAEEDRRKRAMMAIRALVMGVVTRRRITGVMQRHLSRRQQGARTLQKRLIALLLGLKARRRVQKIREDTAEERRQAKAARQIQKRQRGIIGRVKAQRAARRRELERRGPAYYRMKEDYFQQQNMFHRKHVICIQCAVRCRQARDRAYHALQVRYCRVLQQVVRSFLRVRRAKAELERRRQLRLKWIACAVVLQRVAREFLLRCEGAKHRHADLLKQFFRDAVIPSKVYHAKLHFRRRKEQQQFLADKSTKIQAHVRRKQAQAYVKRSRKRLLRLRQQNINARRNRMAQRITGFFWILEAKRAVARRREVLAEEERERLMYEALEASLEGLHEDWVKELLVIRTQKGARAMVARGQFIERVRQHKYELQQEEKRERDEAATCIQALARGVRGRKQFKQREPALRQAQKKRSYCVECEARIAVKRCRDCRDKYCSECFERIHSRGTRRSHGWEYIKETAYSASAARGGGTAASTSRDGGTTGQGTALLSGIMGTTTAQSARKAAAANRSDWEEFFDTSAQSKYWFNKKTGEASWIPPY